jgi:hypothetical protein
MEYIVFISGGFYVGWFNGEVFSDDDGYEYQPFSIDWWAYLPTGPK